MDVQEPIADLIFLQEHRTPMAITLHMFFGVFVMKKLAIVLAVGSAALLGGSPANAESTTTSTTAATETTQPTDFSAHRRHWRHRHHRHWRHGYYRYRPHYRSYGYYAPRPYYYGGPVIRFGFGFGGGHRHHHW
jgi:hypothetical protein